MNKPEIKLFDPMGRLGPVSKQIISLLCGPRQGKTMSRAELAERMGVDVRLITVTLYGLANRNWIKRIEDATDWSCNAQQKWQLTEKGFTNEKQRRSRLGTLERYNRLPVPPEGGKSANIGGRQPDLPSGQAVQVDRQNGWEKHRTSVQGR